MSDRQAQAYLLARDVMRRVRRTATLIDVISRRPTDGASSTREHRAQRH